MFHWNGTASGFIKIYELNHHWKYKTLVRARGGDGRRGVSRGWRDDKEETEWERRNREGRTDCADLIWRNILGAISSAPADIPFESSYQVKGFKSKKRGSDKEPVCLEMFFKMRWISESISGCYSITPPSRWCLCVVSLAKKNKTPQHTWTELCLSKAKTQKHTSWIFTQLFKVLTWIESNWTEFLSCELSFDLVQLGGKVHLFTWRWHQWKRYRANLKTILGVLVIWSNAILMRSYLCFVLKLEGVYWFINCRHIFFFSKRAFFLLLFFQH